MGDLISFIAGHRESILKDVETGRRMGLDGRDCLEDLVVDEVLMKSQLRRVRNFYMILTEICRRDEKLLKW
jgi:hypothetical protein